MFKFGSSGFGARPIDAGAGPEPAGASLDLRALLEIVKRQWPVIALSVVVALGLGFLYFVTAAPRYTASSIVMIDTRRNQLLPGQRVAGESQIDAGFVESQVEVMKSTSVALAVVRELKLTRDAEFVGGEPGAVGSLIAAATSLLGGDAAGEASEEAKENQAVRIVTANTVARRTGLTYVIQIGYTASTPQKAAMIANALGEAYMNGELETKYQATRRASRWLQERIKELREQAGEAERAVQAYKSENNIIDTGRGLMSEQQLGDLNTQIATARASTAEARARLERILQIQNSDIPEGTVVDALRNDVIIRLRAQYLDFSAREADLSRRFGSNHGAAVSLRNQMQEIRRSLRDQLQQIGETYKSEYEIALSREKSLRASMDQLVEQAGATSQAQVKLKDLESSAQAVRNLYDSFLQRSMEATQQLTIPVSEARLITAATDQPNKTWPKLPLVLGGALLAGLGIGIGTAWGREMVSRRFRTPGDVERILGVECLGILPRIEPEDEHSVSPAFPTAPAEMRYALDNPLSRFAEVLRNAKVAVDIARLSREVKVIGIISALPNEGKSTVATNLAQVLAQATHRTLLIDADLRNPSLTRQMTPGAARGLIEVLVDPRALESAVVSDPTSGLDFLPAVVKGRMAQSAELLSSSAMSRLLDSAKDRYDYILIDLAPVSPVIDVKAISPLMDAFICVIEWGESSQQVVVESLESSDLIRDRVLGAVLNKADPVMLGRIESYKGRHYQNYYIDQPGR